MGNNMPHRSTHIASVAIKLAMNGTEFSSGSIQNYLQEQGMENVPAEATINKVLKQLEEDDMLQRTPDNRRRGSEKLGEYRSGRWQSRDEINIETLAKRASLDLEKEIRKRLLNEMDPEKHHYYARNKWRMRDDE